MMFALEITFITKCTCLLQGKIVNRPLAGTVRRGKTEKEDELLEQQLLNDEKQCAEHIMLVDLGRNDVGRVHFFSSKLNSCCLLSSLQIRFGFTFACARIFILLILLLQVSKPGSVEVEKLMNIERYSHVMHISSTVGISHCLVSHPISKFCSNNTNCILTFSGLSTTNYIVISLDISHGEKY